MRRSGIRGLVAISVSIVSLMVLLVGPTRADVESVTGTLVFRERIALSPEAVALVTLTDRSPDGAGTIIGQQRIDAAPSGEIPFSVPFERDLVVDDHAYSVHASVIDGNNEWQNLEPVPVITGGPTQGVPVLLVAPDFANPAQVTGTIAMPPNANDLSDAAVAYAAIINTTSGRMVVRQTLPFLEESPFAFTIGYDADLVDPEATYVAVGAVIDGGRLWQTDAPLPVTPDAELALTVVKTDQDIPSAATPAPSESPTEEPTASPTEEPTASPTGEPSASPTGEPTASPTEEPTPTPTEEPTPTPTEEPTASPSPSPSPTPSPSPSPSASPSPSPSGSPTITPVPTSVSGTLAYRERAALSENAVAHVGIVQVQAGTLTVVGAAELTNPGQVPIAFDVPLADTFDPTLPTELWATIVDGDHAWATGDGVAVATNGAPSQGVVVMLTFRPDLLEGAVSGVINGTGTGLSEAGYYLIWVLSNTGDVLGVDNQLTGPGQPIPWSVPFQMTNLQPDAGYIVRGYVRDGDNAWLTTDDTPVISDGAPFADVQLTVAQVLPTPSPTASPTATATATPAPPPSGGGGIDPLVIALIAGLAVVGAVAVVAVMRR